MQADNPKIWTGCAHHFHLQCILEWQMRKDTVRSLLCRPVARQRRTGAPNTDKPVHAILSHEF